MFSHVDLNKGESFPVSPKAGFVLSKVAFIQLAKRDRKPGKLIITGFDSQVFERFHFPMSLADLRKEYSMSGLLEKDVTRDPFRQFEKWFQEAEAAKLLEPNAMVLSTSTPAGAPSSRVVLLKGLDRRGFIFYTNYESRKGRELAANSSVSLLFPWLALERQVIVEGQVSKVSREESDAYFHSRPIGSQLGAWASRQSTPVTSRNALEESLRDVEKRFAGKIVPLPPDWGGYRVIPTSVEFWQGRRNRMHDRLRYRRDESGEWIIERLSP